MKHSGWLAIGLGLGVLTGCSHVEPAQGDAYAKGAPAQWTPDNRAAVSAPPPGVSQIDIDVVALVRRTLKSDPGLAPISRHVTVSARKGVLTLRGNVPSLDAKQQIVDRVSKLPGVDGIEDQMETGFPGFSPLTYSRP